MARLADLARLMARPVVVPWAIMTRAEPLVGRECAMEVAALAELLHETALRHGKFEAGAPPHDWWDWYAA